MIDDVKSFVDAAHILKDRGAYKIYALATHGILSADAPRLIDESPIDEVCIELVSKELNHLAAILHVYAGGLNFWSKKKLLLFFKKKMEILLHF